MAKYFLALIIAILGALGAIYAWAGIPRVYHSTFLPEPRAPHHFAHPKQSLERITIRAVYFVPSDEAGRQHKDWEAALTENLKKLVAFHMLQFQNRSQIIFRVYPRPIIGRAESAFYNSHRQDDESNADGLAAIRLELTERLLQPSGDLYEESFSRPEADAFPVLAILYEGFGHAGTDGVSLLSRSFLTQTQYRPFAATFFAHEFYHTLGLPDHYRNFQEQFADGQTAAVEFITSEDIMGRVRLPIERTYIEPETLQKMGL